MKQPKSEQLVLRKSPAGHARKRTPHKKKNTFSYIQRQQMLERKKNQKESRAGKVRRYFSNLIFLFFFIVCMLFLFRMATHQVAGHSMAPTFADKDRVLVAKGVHPSRYEIVTFEPKTAQGDSYIKRVIGMPGDVIWVEENTLYINHQAENNPKNLYGQNLAAKELPDGTIQVNVTTKVAKALSVYYKIPENAYFVLGDNRNHSEDSRIFGLVDQNQIEGIVVYRYYPFNKLGVVR
ncbi:S26 family signal peptidase [Enterococcus silesiacus]|uniref:Signal peptidase I n=1 Tax=Enterococcus silesiacus TaxID=332949 RepID=A0A0S3KCB9_9ENTE|nr:signal peptidase I [Enterococcus silesiacus]ALS01896.1 S26 family signal peptidase [Enterococcus silesiacus]OJG92158.1 signal peptidase I [Enterococcus silesiacus]